MLKVIFSYYVENDCYFDSSFGNFLPLETQKTDFIICNSLEEFEKNTVMYDGVEILAIKEINGED